MQISSNICFRIFHPFFVVVGYEPITNVFFLCSASKDKRGRLVEWVEKASFDRPNKLFEISASEPNHQVLLTDKNLQAMVKESKSFIVPILPRLDPRVLVPNEHHMLKDLPSYEVTHVVDAKAHQERLEPREKKHQDNTLRQVPGASHLASSSIVRSLTKKKRPVTQLAQRALTPPFAFPSPSTSASSASSSSSIAST